MEVGVEMPRTLVWKLTKARTEALRASMIQNPAASADLLIAHLCERFFFSTQFARAATRCRWSAASPPAATTSVPAPARATRPAAATAPTSRARRRPCSTTPCRHGGPACRRRRTDCRPSSAALSADDKTSLLALLSAASLNTVTEAAEGSYGRKSDASVSRVAKHVGCDVRKWWQPTAASFFGGLTKAGMVAALDEAYTQTHGKTLSKAAGIDGLKKDAAAGRAEALVSNLDWLPLPMRPAHHVAQPQEAAEPIKLPAAEAINQPAKLAA